jgi:hypothetical protein
MRFQSSAVSNICGLSLGDRDYLNNCALVRFNKCWFVVRAAQVDVESTVFLGPANGNCGRIEPFIANFNGFDA